MVEKVFSKVSSTASSPLCMLCLLFFIQWKKNGHSFSSGDKEGDGLGGGQDDDVDTDCFAGTMCR